VGAERASVRQRGGDVDDEMDEVGGFGEFEEMGPIDYVVLEFPGSRMTGKALPILLGLVERGLIRVLDLAFISKLDDGSVVGMEVSDLDGEDEVLRTFSGAASGMLDEGDLADAAAVLEPGNSAAVLIYENVWAGPFAAEVRRSGGQLVASGRIPIQAVLAALEAAEAR
jgi:hypothetical protein